MSIKKGDHVKDFTLQNSSGKNVNLSDLVTAKKTLLLFFPLAFSGVCTDELCQTRDNMKMYNSLNAEVAAISIDSFFTLREFKKTNNLNFTLLSDFNREVSTQFGVLDEDFFGMKGVAKRSAFVMNQDMKVEYAEVLEDSDMLPDFKAILKVLAS
jgi:glutaredoxin-dependent peroxiredoxin